MSKLQIPEWEKREKTIYVECEEVDDRIGGLDEE